MDKNRAQTKRLNKELSKKEVSVSGKLLHSYALS